MISRIIQGEEVDQKDMENFGVALSELGRASEFTVDNGYLGDLINGKLDAIVRDRDLARETMEMSGDVKRCLRVIADSQRTIILADETFRQFRVRNIPSLTELGLKYDMEGMKKSQDFLFAVHNSAAVNQIKHEWSEEINEILKSYLTVLEEYE